MPENFDLAALLAPVISLSREAGSRILEVYNTEFSVEMKSDNSPLTQADLASHHHLVRGINQIEPAFPLISEESNAIPYSERKSWEFFWLIDPLDGTREFIKRNGEFTVNVALIRDNTPILGVVYIPVSDICYFAAQGKGAFRQDNENTPEPVRARRKAPARITVAGSRSHNTGRLAQYLDRLGEYDLIAMGSSMKFCLVAEGTADLYPRLGPTSEWDTAAAQCIVEEAGGRVTQIGGKPLRYNTKESYLNPHFLAFGDHSRDWSQYAD